MFQNNQILFIIVALIASIYGLYYLHTKKVDTVGKIGILLIISGALGNLIDRVRLGFVVDYFDFRIIWNYVKKQHIRIPVRSYLKYYIWYILKFLKLRK